MYVSKRKTAYDVRIRDWRSDVCSSDRHEIIIGLLRIEGRDPFAGGGAPAHEADRFVEDIDVIARAFQEHPVIGVLAKLLRIERERIIVPRIFERLVCARLSAGVGRAGIMVGTAVRKPALLHLFGEIAAGPLRIVRRLAEIFIGGLVVEVYVALPPAAET